MKKFFIVIATFFCAHQVQPSPIISLYLQQPPLEARITDEKNVNKAEIANTFNGYISRIPPSKLSKKLVQGKLRQNQLPSIGGFLGLYAGLSDYSDDDGFFGFPRLHTAEKLYLVITKKIDLEMIKEETISHLEFRVEKDTPIAIYLFERKEDENGIFFWDVSEQPRPPDNRLNPLSMVILTNPKNIFVPLGHFMTVTTKHFILPPAFVVGAFEQEEVILSSLDIKRYFEPVSREEKNVAKTKNQQLIVN